MLPINNRKHSRIFVLVLAAVIGFSNVSQCGFIDRSIVRADDDEEARSNERTSSLYDADKDADKDADIFVAEIFPEGNGDLEQIFRPLARYKKAVLGLDAQIEPVRDLQITKDGKFDSSDIVAHSAGSLKRTLDDTSKQAYEGGESDGAQTNNKHTYRHQIFSAQNGQSLHKETLSNVNNGRRYFNAPMKISVEHQLSNDMHVGSYQNRGNGSKDVLQNEVKSQGTYEASEQSDVGISGSGSGEASGSVETESKENSTIANHGFEGELSLTWKQGKSMAGNDISNWGSTKNETELDTDDANITLGRKDKTEEGASHGEVSMGDEDSLPQHSATENSSIIMSHNDKGGTITAGNKASSAYFTGEGADARNKSSKLLGGTETSNGRGILWSKKQQNASDKQRSGSNYNEDSSTSLKMVSEINERVHLNEQPANTEGFRDLANQNVYMDSESGLWEDEQGSGLVDKHGPETNGTSIGKSRNTSTGSEYSHLNEETPADTNTSGKARNSTFFPSASKSHVAWSTVYGAGPGSQDHRYNTDILVSNGTVKDNNATLSSSNISSVQSEVTKGVVAVKDAAEKALLRVNDMESAEEDKGNPLKTNSGQFSNPQIKGNDTSKKSENSTRGEKTIGSQSNTEEGLNEIENEKNVKSNKVINEEETEEDENTELHLNESEADLSAFKENEVDSKSEREKTEMDTISTKKNMDADSKLSREEAARKIFISSVHQDEDEADDGDDVEEIDEKDRDQRRHGNYINSLRNQNQDASSNDRTKITLNFVPDNVGSRTEIRDTQYQPMQSTKGIPSWSPAQAQNGKKKQEGSGHTNETFVAKSFGSANSQKSHSGVISSKQNKSHSELKSHTNTERLGGVQTRKREKTRRKEKGKKGSKNNLNFITTMMSFKARELYKNLIYDTSKALMSKKKSQDARNRHFVMKIPMQRETKSSSGKNVVYFPNATDSVNEVQTGAAVKIDDRNKLTTRLLQLMAENDEHLMKQAAFLPIKSGKKSYQKEVVPEKLDSPHTLIEKLAELKYVDHGVHYEKEVPIPEIENSEDTSLSGPDLEKENPGKTVLQKQSKVGLAANINMDTLDGSKDEYELNDLDGKIEGELAKSEMMDRTSKETSIGTLSSVPANATFMNITESTAKAAVVPGTLSAYNAEESLEHEAGRYQGNENFTLNEDMEVGKERQLNQTMSPSEKNAQLKGGKVVEDIFATGLQGDRRPLSMWKKKPAMYFAGNSSLWKHHPVVSMDIEPLVDVFYKVNHKNLIDLVQEEDDQKIEPKDDEREGESTRVRKMRRKKTKKRKKTMAKNIRPSIGKEGSAMTTRRKKGKKNQREDHEVRAEKRKHRNRKIDTGLMKSNLNTGKIQTSLVSDNQHKVKIVTNRQKAEKRKNRKKFKQRYKHKHKKPVKGTAKFGISERLRAKSPPETPEAKNNMPYNVRYYKIEKAAKLGAVCIDGSIPGYYFREGSGDGVNKWIIHLHGGAWCYDPETCFRRSYSILGSTNHWSAENITNFFQGILSGNRETNPYFSNWNVIVQSYCDGGLFSGRRKEPLVYRGRRLYFRGRQILKALVESLKRRNIGKASDVLLSGTSAGGLAVLLQGDYLRHKLPRTASVRGLVDAGFFIDSEAEDGSNVIGNQFRGIYSIHNPKLRKKCEKARDSSSKFQCLFPQYTIEDIKLPIYFVNALYDHWQLSELQRLRCIYNNDKCNTAQRDRILNFRQDMISRLKDSIGRLPHAGLFADSCIGHGQVIVDYTWSRIRVGNSTLRDAFVDWMRDRTGAKRHVKVDCHYPCNGSCPRAMVNSCIKNFKGTSNNHRAKRNAELC